MKPKFIELFQECFDEIKHQKQLLTQGCSQYLGYNKIITFQCGNMTKPVPGIITNSYADYRGDVVITLINQKTNRGRKISLTDVVWEGEDVSESREDVLKLTKEK